ncbi:MAG: tRNA (cytidine(34)-2'-O)-methyltransferase [Lautropia sp.]
MFNVVLVEPEIPPNTGNVIRLCANSGCRLHLIEPLGFPINHAKMRRAGLDYHEITSLRVHPSWEAFVERERPARCYALSTRGRTRPSDCRFEPGDCFVFGRETRGLPDALVARFPEERVLRLPMRPGNRSINLSNAVAIVVYEAWGQLGFAGSAPRPDSG